MTPNNKCEHKCVASVTEFHAESTPVVGWRCADCGQRFVPADVLEEVRAGIYEAGTQTGDGGDGERARDLLKSAVARIDAALGEVK